MNSNEKKFDDTLKLTLAMGEIDDRLIDEARRPAPIFLTMKNTCILAASLLLVTVISIAAGIIGPALAPAKGEAPDNSNGPEENVFYNIGETVILGDSNVTLIDKTDGKFTLLLNLSEDIESLDLYIYGYKFEVANGQPLSVKIAATTSSTSPDGYVSVPMPEIAVNGETATALPTAKGSYTITINTAALTADNCALSSIEITYFNVGFNYN